MILLKVFADFITFFISFTFSLGMVVLLCYAFNLSHELGCKFLNLVELRRFLDIIWQFVNFLLYQIIEGCFYLVHTLDSLPQSLLFVFRRHYFAHVVPWILIYFNDFYFILVESEVRWNGCFVLHDLFQISTFLPIVGESIDRNFRITYFSHHITCGRISYAKNFYLSLNLIIKRN